MVITLRALTADDHAPLLALQHGLGARPAWSSAWLAEQLTDVAREHGRNVVVAERDGRVVGCAGWVDGGEMFFGAPVLAPEREVAELLIDAVIARAAGAHHLRIGAAPYEPAKLAALAARGFAVALAFPTLGIASGPRAFRIPGDLRWVAPPAADPDALVVLHNEAFAHVDNSRPVDRDEALAMVAHGWPEASGVWLDDQGRAAAMVITVRDRDHGADRDHLMIDMIAVAGFAQRRGLARAIVDRTVDRAATCGIPEVRALIASTNAASLALHRAAGFTELWRRDMWQLTL
ncbi:MAG: GNAT family N-acetyltransferase [Deltaproteobacteria bacterium]|nr:GNAT family N-acetyltransferase [Deltaproteobacteria bacterium]